MMAPIPLTAAAPAATTHDAWIPARAGTLAAADATDKHREHRAAPGRVLAAGHGRVTRHLLLRALIAGAVGWVCCLARAQDHAAWAVRTGRVNPAVEGMDDPSYGAESNPTGDPIGGGTGYARIVPPEAATATVQTAEELLAALAAAQAGQVIYVPDDAIIDLTPHTGIALPAGVTLAGGRGLNGSEGGLLFTRTIESTTLFRTAGPNIRITGLRLEGSYPGRERLIARPSLLSITQNHVEVDNCEIYAWSASAIGVGSGAAEGAWVHHNYIHHCQRAGLGYGVSLGRTHVLIEGNLFDFCRHAIASSGYPGSGYTARYNVHLENSISHLFDMHGARDYEKYRQVGLWHFDEGQGDTTADHSIYNGNHRGSLVNLDATAWVDGYIGPGAIRLDGQQGYVDLGKQRQLEPRDGLALAAWVKPDSVAGVQTVFGKGDTGEQGSGYALRLVDGQLEGILYDAQRQRCLARGGRLDPGKWHYVAMTWALRPAGDAVLYVDGQEVARFTCKQRSPSPNALLVGRDSATATAFFRGTIDEARLYNAAISADDVVRQFQGHGDLAGDLIIVHHNTFRHTQYPALAVRGRPSTGCWAHRNLLEAGDDATMFRQTNATGNWHIADNQYRRVAPAIGPDFSRLPALGQWRFGSGQGTAVPDASGRGRPAAATLADGTGAWIETPDGGAFAFTGEAAGGLTIPKPEWEQHGNRFAVGLRFRYDTMKEHEPLLDDGLMRFFHRGGWAGSRLYFLVRLDGSGRSGHSSWDGYAGLMTTTHLTAGEWYDVIGEMDGEWMRLYVNGRLEAEERCLAGQTPATTGRGDILAFQGVKAAIADLWIRPASSQLPEVQERGPRVATLATSGEPGYEDDGVEPDSGSAETLFHFRVLCRDAAGRTPAIGFPRVHVLRDGRPYLNAAPVTMIAADAAPLDQGRIYTYSMRLPRGRNYAHFFETETVDGESSRTTTMAGPVVETGSSAPVLSWTNQPGYVIAGVQPFIGNVSTDFDFRILFSDLDGDDPAPGYPKVHILRGKEEIPGSPFAMEPMNDTQTYTGRPYRYRTKLAAGDDYAVFFTARDVDGNEAPRTGTRREPTVDAGADIAPPTITEIRAVEIGPDSAVIAWQTDEPATGAVEYGDGGAYSQTRSGPAEPGKEHRVLLTGLRPNTAIQYRVSSTDLAGNRAVSGGYTFQTAPP